MNILVTNDDGIDSEGIKILAKWAAAYGEVTVVAPKVQQSGKSHSIEIHKAFEVLSYEFEDGIEAYSVDSSPADCVRYGIIGLNRQYNLVLSGINKGLNLGEDIGYSGTCGAIFEAGYLKTPAIAFSTDPSSFVEAEKQLDKCYEFIQFNNLFEYSSLYNVNIPLESKEILITHMGEAYYRDTYESQGNNMFKPKGYSLFKGTADLSMDRDAALNGYISVTPMTVDRTDLATYNLLLGKNLKHTF